MITKKSQVSDARWKEVGINPQQVDLMVNLTTRGEPYLYATRIAGVAYAWAEIALREGLTLEQAIDVGWAYVRGHSEAGTDHIDANTEAERVFESYQRKSTPVNDAANWLAPIAAAVVNKDVAALTDLKPLGVAELGKPQYDSAERFTYQLAAYAGDPDFQKLLADKIRGKLTHPVAEAEIDSVVNAIVATALSNGVDEKIDRSDTRAFVYRNDDNAERNRRKQILVLVSLLKTGSSGINTVITDTKTYDELEKSIRTLVGLGLLAQDRIKIKKDDEMFSNLDATVAQLTNTYSLVVTMKRYKLPRVINYDDLVPDITFARLDVILQGVKAALIAA
jgi:hypothetical protein